MLQTGNGLQQLPLSAARNAGDAQNFSASRRKGDVGKHLHALHVGQRHMLHLQPIHAIVRHGSVNIQCHLFAHGQLGFGCFACLNGAHIFAFSQDRNPVGKSHHLVHFMGNDHNGLSVLPHLAQYCKQPVTLLGSQHGGRLVQNQNVCSPVKHLDDFHRLLLRNRHLIDLFVGIDQKSVFFGNLHDPCSGILLAELLSVVHAQHDVFRGAENIHQLEMLMDHSDFVSERIFGRSNNRFFSVNIDPSGIRVVNPRNHIHQCGFSASVFTENRQDLPSVNRKIHIDVRPNASKALGDILQSDRWYLLFIHLKPPAKNNIKAEYRLRLVSYGFPINIWNSDSRYRQ